MKCKTIIVALAAFGASRVIAYPIHVFAKESAMRTFVQLLDNGTSAVKVHQVNLQNNEFGIGLIRPLYGQGYATRENRFQCALVYLLGDSTKSYRLNIVENDPTVLIGDGRRAIIDIDDIKKFETSGDNDFTAFNVLLHELYEQYQLQVVGRLKPGKITDAQLGKAHQKAIQKESNFYSVTMLRTKGDIYGDYIDIEFTNRTDFSRHHFIAYFSDGNIERVEMTRDSIYPYSKN